MGGWLLGQVQKIWFCVAFIELGLIYQFIYGFSLVKVKRLAYILLGIIVIICFITPMGESGEVMTCAAVLLGFKGLIFAAADKHRFRHSLWIWPVLCTGAIPSIIIEALFKILDMEGIDYIERIISELALGGVLGTVYYLNKKKSISTVIRGKDRYIVSISSAFIMYVGISLTDSEFSNLFSGANKMIRVIGWIGIVILTFLILWVIMKESKLDYYKVLSDLNEKQTQEAYEHFRAYKEADSEIRKLKHDMKNHLLCMQALIEQGKQEKLKEYLAEINEQIAEISPMTMTGNDMVDTVLSVKQHMLKENNVEVEIIGSLLGVDYIKPIDWSTIFANSIDNAIEALKQIDGKRILTMEFKRNQHFIVIRLSNPCLEEKKVKKNRIKTTKQDMQTHGFGLENIERAISKYQGSMQVKFISKEEKTYFELNILLPLKNQGE